MNTKISSDPELKAPAKRHAMADRRWIELAASTPQRAPVRAFRQQSVGWDLANPLTCCPDHDIR
eukprot:8032290-Pyramimonas_sp.AAC.1